MEQRDMSLMIRLQLLIPSHWSLWFNYAVNGVCAMSARRSQPMLAAAIEVISSVLTLQHYRSITCRERCTLTVVYRSDLDDVCADYLEGREAKENLLHLLYRWLRNAEHEKEETFTLTRVVKPPGSGLVICYG
jgi:hypothetical protein